MEFRRFSDVDVLVGKGIIGHDPESRGADRNGFRFTLVGTPVRFSRHDGTWSTETSFLDESARRKSVNLVEIVPSSSPSFLFFLALRREHPTRFLNLLLALDIKTDVTKLDEEKYFLFFFVVWYDLVDIQYIIYIFNDVKFAKFSLLILEWSRGKEVCEVKFVEIYI